MERLVDGLLLAVGANAWTVAVWAVVLARGCRGCRTDTPGRVFHRGVAGVVNNVSGGGSMLLSVSSR